MCLRNNLTTVSQVPQGEDAYSAAGSRRYTVSYSHLSVQQIIWHGSAVQPTREPGAPGTSPPAALSGDAAAAAGSRPVGAAGVAASHTCADMCRLNSDCCEVEVPAQWARVFVQYA